jgi:hypothetical protein
MLPVRVVNMETNNPLSQFKQRQFTRIFEGLDDELIILAANAKFNYTTRKTDENTLKLTLAYIEDTNKLVAVLKNRINLLMQTNLTFGVCNKDLNDEK